MRHVFMGPVETRRVITPKDARGLAITRPLRNVTPAMPESASPALHTRPGMSLRSSSSVSILDDSSKPVALICRGSFIGFQRGDARPWPRVGDTGRPSLIHAWPLRRPIHIASFTVDDVVPDPVSIPRNTNVAALGLPSAGSMASRTRIGLLPLLRTAAVASPHAAVGGKSGPADAVPPPRNLLSGPLTDFLFSIKSRMTRPRTANVRHDQRGV